ncbi:outer membrane protein assembly factor BamD [Campylobacterota bacterium]
MKLKYYVSVFIISIVFTGCAKEVSEYNKPAAYWYEKIIDSVANGSLENADGYFSSLQSEHIGSPLLPEATIIMAQAHMRLGEYVLAEHFLDEYISRFADPREREFAEYLKIRAKFMGLPNPRRDQTLIYNTIKSGEEFIKHYPNSQYSLEVNTMLVKLYLARANLNHTISNLYERLDKPKASKIYADKQAEKWIDWNKVESANTPWYREIFEGDGSESWYASWIPKSKSVISQDAEGNTKE